MLLRSRAEFLLVLLVGCGGNVPQGEPVTGVATRGTPLVLVDSSAHLGNPAREPMVVVHPSGTLFASGYGGEARGYRGDDPEVPRIVKSLDLGKHWTPVDVGGRRDGAIGGVSDLDMAVAPDGTLYHAALLFDPEAWAGVRVGMGMSRDGGTSWHWTKIDSTRFDDRPWVEVARDGTAHVVWSTDHGVFHSKSSDRGITWSQPSVVNPVGGSSHFSVGPAGTLAVRIGPRSAGDTLLHSDADQIAVSRDGGMTWQKHAPPARFDWDGEDALPGWVEPIAWDSSGALYAFWSRGYELQLARSTDDGATWRQWTVVQGEVQGFYPVLVTRGDKVFAATWMSRSGEGMLLGHLAVVDARGEDPQVSFAPPFLIDVEARAEGTFDTGGEYLPAVFLPDGSIGVAFPIQNYSASQFGFGWRRYAASP
jgi:hypothetical protein